MWLRRWWVRLSIVVLLVLGGGGLYWSRMVVKPPHTEEPVLPSDHDLAIQSERCVRLSHEKVTAAGVTLDPLQMRNMQLHRTVPGRLEYDDTFHVEVRVPTDGILTEVHVKPGDLVHAGQVIALLHSPEVAHARADVLKLQAEKNLAERQFQWHETTCQSLGRLVEAIQPQLKQASFELAPQSQELGEYRERIISALTRYQLANSLAQNLESLAASGAVSLSSLQQRRSEQQAADAALKSATEQSLFEAQQACTRSSMQASDAQQRLEIGQQHVRTLLGYEDPLPASTTATARNLSLVEVRAPFTGTIETKPFSASERVKAGDTVCVLADTTRLWAKGDVRDRDWQLLQIAPGTSIQVELTSDPPQSLTGQIYYVGREMDVHTNAVPVIAAVANPQGTLRPGQFVRMSLPLDKPRRAWAVPASAIMQHDGAQFVFVERTPGDATAKQREFLSVTVRTGVTVDDYTEIIDGLSENVKVVTRGAFYLKSEWLLAGEQ